MIRLTRERFEELAEAALSALPAEFREALVDVEIAVRAMPGKEAGRWRGSRTLLGLYTGLTREEMKRTDQPYEPARILLYQRNLESDCADEPELAEQIAVTLRHEIGHHFGMGDARLHRLGH